MIFLHIDPTTSKKSNLFNKYVREGKLIFVLFYMEGCGLVMQLVPSGKN